MPDPATAAAAGALAMKASGKAAAERGVTEVARKAERVGNALTGSCKIVSQEISIRYPEALEVISIAFEPHPGLLGQRVRFPFGRPHRVRLRSILGNPSVAPAALAVSESGFEIRTRELQRSQLFLLDIEYRLEHPRLLDALVEKHVPRETPKTNSTEYWLHAELRHPAALKTRYTRFDLQDLEFSVDVGVSENVKTVLPDALVKELDTAVRLLEERDKLKKRVLGEEHVEAMEIRGRESTVKLLGSLQAVFTSTVFRSFVDVRRDFHYSDCERGVNFYDTLPIPTWPRSMKVISRTDLSILRPASQGTLLYKRDEFQKKVGEILGKA